jgi:hypothetical protein
MTYCFICSLGSQAARLVAAHDGLVLLAPQELVKAAVAAFHAEKVTAFFGRS